MKKIAVITGASSGIGKALSIELSKEYDELFLCGRNSRGLETTKSLCAKDQAKINLIPLDLNDRGSIVKAVAEIQKETDEISLLVNNAGQSQRSLIENTSEQVEEQLMQTNYFGPVLFSKLLLPALRKHGRSKIAVTSSIVGKFGYPLRSSYSAAKHALHGFFESLRFEEKKNGVSVLMLVIGRVQTQVSVNALTADGEQYGKMDAGQSGGITTEDCANQIISALKSQKKEVLIGGKEILMVKFKKYLPFLFYRIAEKESNHV